MTRRYALTDEQIDQLATEIARRIVSEYGLAHYREAIASTVEKCLMGTPLVGAEKETE